MLGGASTISADLDAVTEVTAIIEQRAIRSVFQPIVRLDTREVVAYEALARGPSGTRWRSPTALYCAAAAIGRTAELDWVCRAAAYRAALQADLSPAVALFVGVDPATVDEPCPYDLRSVVALAHDRLRVVIELTERGVCREPAMLLASAEAARRTGCGVALGDVGVDPAALALLPLVRPDVVKLDGYLLQRSRHVETARAVAAVASYADHAGAVVVAEGMERAGHLVTARRMGATLGQGWLLGRPDALPESLGQAEPTEPGGPLEPLRLLDEAGPGAGPGGRAACETGETPYDIVAVERQVTLTDKATLLAISRYLEMMAHDAVAEPPVVLACVQDAHHFTGATRRRYSALAERSALVATFGVGLADDPAPAVVGVRLGPAELLRDEWHVIVFGPHFAAALVARDLGDGGPQGERRFVHAVTYDRDLVLAAARPLLRRLASSRLLSERAKGPND